jgi:hypothetical protein
VGPQAGEPPVRAEFAAWHRKEVSGGLIVCSGAGWGSEGTGDRAPRPASLCHRVRCRAAMRMSDESPSLHLAWRSRRDTRVAIHPSISDSSQPTAFVVSLRLEGNCPRHSRRQSVVRDSPVRAQTSRHRRKRAGERPTCAGCSDASVPSWLSRALLTSADATRWRLKVATCVHCGERIRLAIPRPHRPTDFPSVGRNEARSGRNSAAPGRANPKENGGTRVSALSPHAAWFGAEW